MHVRLEPRRTLDRFAVDVERHRREEPDDDREHPRRRDDLAGTPLDADVLLADLPRDGERFLLTCRLLKLVSCWELLGRS